MFSYGYNAAKLYRFRSVPNFVRTVYVNKCGLNIRNTIQCNTVQQHHKLHLPNVLLNQKLNIITFINVEYCTVSFTIYVFIVLNCICFS